MTNVQTPTGLASPVAERATLPRRHSSVCRNLFGPIDHDALNRELKATLKEISERDQRRWNFHFETDTPIPGSYEWEGMSAESMPAFYQESERFWGVIFNFDNMTDNFKCGYHIFVYRELRVLRTNQTSRRARCSSFDRPRHHNLHSSNNPKKSVGSQLSFSLARQKRLK
uniref:Cyclin dependent kinase inhibitor 1Ca n=1 Tax=Salmo trutta TaxID=8032 RepID=A0A673Y077_SALTR